MEPTSVNETKTGGRGSLSDPETHEVPGHVIPILTEEFDDFDSEAAKFMRGETPENEFIGFRLKQGVYGQRQPGVQMIRIKLPMGGITPDQLDAFASVVEKYVPLKKAHITTRQNIQLHHVPLPDAAKLIRELSDAGLSSREGCGNTVRNVTGDPLAGITAGEIFDTTPYAGAFVRYFVRHPTTQLMPRKIKTAFDGSPGVDRSLTGIHDIAFIAKIREDGTKGFEVFVGGGTSIMPRIAPKLYDFVEAENGEYLEVAEAVFRIFDNQDFLRVNRARARIKVLIDKIGMDEFRTMVDEERKGSWVAERHFDVAGLRMDVDEEANAPALSATYATPNGDLSEFERFSASNVHPQKQEGFSAVEVKVTRGDLSPEQLRSIADLVRKYSGGWMRMTVHQNFVMRWVRDESVYELWKELVELGIGDAGVDEITDVVSCPGTDSCKMGITSSMGLNSAVQARVTEMNITDALTKKIHIKMSGCPNGCSQHHIANIGFYGASIKVGEHTIPAYVAHIGGNYDGGEIIYGTRLKIRLPAKRIPDAVQRWLEMYQRDRFEGEEFNAFADRIGTKVFEDEARDLSLPVEFGLDTMNEFIDWNRKVPFVVARGEGECAV
jgi:sulfite reductase beta subunit-like hemoprotein